MYLILAKLEAYPRLKKEDKSSRSYSIKKPAPLFLPYALLNYSVRSSSVMPNNQPKQSNQLQSPEFQEVLESPTHLWGWVRCEHGGSRSSSRRCTGWAWRSPWPSSPPPQSAATVGAGVAKIMIDSRLLSSRWAPKSPVSAPNPLSRIDRSRLLEQSWIQQKRKTILCQVWVTSSWDPQAIQKASRG